MASKKENKAVCWVVTLEGMSPAYVVAESWEQATVKAADFWGIPWGANVAHMELQQKMEARKNVCLICRKIFFGDGELCAACETARVQDKQNHERRMKATWYMGKKNAAFGR